MRYRTKALLLVAAALALPGCDPDLPKTYPVTGKVALSGGDAAQLAGHCVEVVLQGNPNVRASGVIGPDGTFALDTLHAGHILKGVQEGKYQARILRNEEDDDGKKLKKPPVAPRFLKFDSTPLSIDVPPAGEVTLNVQAR
jgi:hypothetical protein